MIVREALATGRRALEHGAIEDAALESELLLRHVLGATRAALYVGLDVELCREQEESFRALLQRRLKHEPSAYITGRRESYGLDFSVDRRVLIPRPETELVVDAALEWATGRGDLIMGDIGTGSGAIGVALAHYLPRARIYATDISETALQVAAENCRRHGVEDRVVLLNGDLLRPLPEPVDLIVANLPYVSRPDMGTLAPEVRLFEPGQALDGGEDGLDQIRRLIGQLGGKLRPGGCLVLEIGAGQREVVGGLLRGEYSAAEVFVTHDWNGIPRVVRMVLPVSSASLRTVGILAA